MLLEGRLSHYSSRGSSQKGQRIFLEGRQAVLPMALLPQSPSADRGQSPEREPPVTTCPVPVHEDAGCTRPCRLSLNPHTSPGGSDLMVTHTLQMQNLKAHDACLHSGARTRIWVRLSVCLSVYGIMQTPQAAFLAPLPGCKSIGWALSM